MKLTPITLTTLEVTGIQGLDPIRLYLQDLGAGIGRLTFECYGTPYSAFWGAMGPQTVREFVASIDLGYFMTRCGVKKSSPYTRRLFTAVQEACKAEFPTIPAISTDTPPNLLQIGDLWHCEDEHQVRPAKVPHALLIQCSSEEQCRQVFDAGNLQFTKFAHWAKAEIPAAQ